ncbi:MAG: hypothetical protein WCF57_11335 [Pyrinomonadaceae bacterium]
MRRRLRPIAFVLALCSIAAVCYALAYGSSSAKAPVQSNSASVVRTRAPQPPDAPPTPAGALRFGPLDELSGFTNTAKIVLRRSPEAGAPVIANLNVAEYLPVKIVEATRDFIRIKIDAPTASKDDGDETAEYEGWTDWGSVVPHMAAIVLDAETGAVVSRVPLTSLETAVAYSQDGSRAIFYRTEDSGEPVLGYEVTTDDYALSRSVLASDAGFVRPVFYSPVDNALAAFGVPQAGEKSQLSLMRLNDFYTFDMPTTIAATATRLIVSPDGRTGFIFHPQDNERPQITIDVVDLQSLEIRHTIALGEEQVSWREGFAVSKDGSEIYLERPESISVIDTLTGQQLREYSKKFAGDSWVYYTQESIVGGSLFVKWSRGEDERLRSAWLDINGRVAADPEIESVVEAGGAGFAINAAGTRLFRLDKDHHINDRLPIDRPELRRRKEAENDLTTYSLQASPDGKHIILFIGIQEHGC